MHQHHQRNHTNRSLRLTMVVAAIDLALIAALLVIACAKGQF